MWNDFNVCLLSATPALQLSFASAERALQFGFSWLHYVALFVILEQNDSRKRLSQKGSRFQMLKFHHKPYTRHNIFKIWFQSYWTSQTAILFFVVGPVSMLNANVLCNFRITQVFWETTRYQIDTVDSTAIRWTIDLNWISSVAHVD